MTLIVATAAAAGGVSGGDLDSSKDSYPTPTLCKWEGSLTRFAKKSNADMEVTENKPTLASKKTCICAPTSHAGSFRCSLHRTTSSTTEQKYKEYNSDREEISEKLYFIKMLKDRKFNNQPRLSRFGRAAPAGLAANDVSGDSN